MKKTDIAWAAGMFDGEGCVRIRRQLNSDLRNPHHSLVVDMTNTHRETVERFTSIMGVGTIYEYKKKGSYSYRATSQKALKVLTLLLPYLVTKREQAEVAIKFMSIPTNSGYGQKTLDLETVEARQQIMDTLSEMKRSLRAA